MRTRGLRPTDLVIGGGLVLLVASFLPWYGLRVGGFATDDGQGGPWVNAWQGSPAWWVPVLAGGVVAALWLARRAGRLTADWLPPVAVAVSVLGLLLVTAQLVVGSDSVEHYAWFAYAPPGEAPLLETGPRFGVVAALCALILQAAAAAAEWRQRPAAEPA